MYFEVNVSIRLHPQTIPANNSDKVGGYLSSSCCAVSSAPVFRLLAMEDFLKRVSKRQSHGLAGVVSMYS